MLTGFATLPKGLAIRPARTGDDGFLEKLNRDSRDDIRMADADKDFIEAVLDQQLVAQTTGYGTQFPNALYFIVEKTGERVGKLTLDWGGTEARVVDLGFVRKARGKGFGEIIIKALLAACGPAKCPLAVTCLKNRPALYRFLIANGFMVAETTDTADLLVWYPKADDMKP
jgi:GNAT superfamily N-acetyltransferase